MLKELRLQNTFLDNFKSAYVFFKLKTHLLISICLIFWEHLFINLTYCLKYNKFLVNITLKILRCFYSFPSEIKTNDKLRLR